MPDPQAETATQPTPVAYKAEQQEPQQVKEPRPEISQKSFYEAEKSDEDIRSDSPPVIQPAKPATNVTLTTLKLNPKTPPIATKQEDQPQMSENLPKAQVSYSDFVKKWNAMAQNFATESQSLYVALTSHQPTLEAQGTISLSIDNPVQEKLINDRKGDILNFLWKELNNFSLKLELSVLPSVSQNEAYLPQDKLQRMIDKNPAILRLCKELDLDFYN